MDKAERFQKLTCTAEVRRDLRGRSVRAAGFTGLASGADFAIRIGSTAVLARLIIPEHFGLVMMVMAVTAVAEQLRELGLSAATVQQKEITHEQVSNLFWINVAAGACLALLVAALSPLIAAYYQEPRLIAITCLLATNFLIGGLMVQHQALLTRQLKLGYTSAIRFSSSLVSTILAIILGWLDFGYWALVWREVARSVLLTGGMWFCFPWIPGLPSRQTDVRSMVGFGANLSLANISTSLTAGVDRFLIGRIWGAGPVAMYRQAFQLMISTTDQLVGPIYSVAQPALSLLQGDPLRFRRFYQKVLSIVCVITMPLSLFVAVYSSEIVRLVLGPNWTGCGPVLMILSFGTFIRQASGSTAYVLISRGGSRAYLNLALLNNGLFIALALLGARWGLIGVAVADVVTVWLMVLPRVYYSFKDSPVTTRDFISAAARPFTASLIMAGTLWGLRFAMLEYSHLLTLGAGALASLVVFPTAWLLLPGGREEMTRLVGDMRSMLQRKSAPSIAIPAVQA